MFVKCAEQSWNFETCTRYFFIQDVRRKKESYEGYSS